jgi:LIM and senescent cell antigen-like-containing domain protein 1/2
MCSKCKKPIFGDYITIRGQRMHPEHYTCEMCGCGFVGGNCHERDGKYYCEECYRRLMMPVCFACQKPIPGRSITALGKVYHPEHFVCAQCHTPFPDGQFYEVNMLPYCEMHYKELFAERCAKCDRAIVGQETKGCGKSWHPGCFVCTACEAPFPTMQFWPWEEKPYCTKCFDKLPEKVRRKILQKKQVESTVHAQQDRLVREAKAKEAKKAMKEKMKDDKAKKAARAAAIAKARDKYNHM